MGKKSKRRINAKREPNGQLSRRKDEMARRMREGMDRAAQEAISVGVSARERVFGVPADLSRDQMAGSYVGRLCLCKQISTAQYDAAMTYLEDWQNNAAAIGMPHSASAVDLNRVHGRTDVENVSRSRQAMDRWRKANEAVQGRQNELRGVGNLFGALDHCLLRDHDHDHLVGSLREALNALARHYRIVDRQDAA